MDGKGGGEIKGGRVRGGEEDDEDEDEKEKGEGEDEKTTRKRKRKSKGNIRRRKDRQVLFTYHLNIQTSWYLQEGDGITVFTMGRWEKDESGVGGRGFVQVMGLRSA